MLPIEKRFSLDLNSISFEEEKTIRKKVENIVEDVYYHRDKAVVKYTRKYDCPSFKEQDIELQREKIEPLDPYLSRTIQEAASRIESFALAQKKGISKRIEANSCAQISLPLEKVGVYIPGGKAPLFSSVLMTVIPARVAGVKEIYLVTPPDEKKQISPLIQYTANLVGVDKVFRVGGAQAIAALAFGTDCIPKVDKIVGPGNAYVQMSKKLLFGWVGIDTLAGPSEIIILADESANPEFIACDLIAQAEHGEDSVAILITDSHSLAHKVRDLISKFLKDSPRKNIIRPALKNKGKIMLVKDLDQGLQIINTLSPEHLSLQMKNPEKLLNRIRNAAAVFVGSYSPVALGDYWAGPSHVLPTSGAARFSSPLGVKDFLKETTIISFTQKDILPEIEKISMLARQEGLSSHAHSLLIRRK